MTAVPFTIERDESNQLPCVKCEALKRRGESRHTRPATYVLRQGAQSWRLCSNCAARASHTMALPHPCFNPSGKSLALTTKE